jgi:hypothetical protein
VAQGVERLLCKQKAQSSTPVPPKKRKKEKQYKDEPDLVVGSSKYFAI